MIAPDQQAVLDWIDSQNEHMIFLTESWSRINSGSYNIDGVRAMRVALTDHFSWLEGEQEVVPMSPLVTVDAKGQEQAIPIAEALTIRKRPEAPIQVLLVGHMDTVYGLDHPFQQPNFVSETILNGPGVADLKGGLVVMLKALEAFERSPYADRLGWQVVLNPDEEIGSISSDPLLKKACEGKRLGLIYEPALADGSLAGERKGSGNFSMVVRGRSAHAGRNPQDGRNAIVAAAELAQALFALNGKRPGVTLNPAKIEGGSAMNVVPDLAVLRFNVRIQQASDEAWIISEMDRLIDALGRRDGFSATRHGFFTRRPKPMSPENKQVFDLVLSCGRDLGLEIGIKPSGGCCDGNNLWQHGLPNVDTLGVRGANIHSSDEIVYLDSLAERAKLSALLLMRLAAGENLPA